MKINGISTNGPAAPGRPVARSTTERAAEATAGEVHLSHASAELGARPSVDSARVQEVRQAILDGRFAINSAAIADRLIVSARELVGGQAHR